MQIVRIGLDLAKYVFEVHGVDAEEKVVLHKTLRRDRARLLPLGEGSLEDREWR